ncbi:MAG: ester cyclase [Vicinamibacterales bacterium]
MKPADLRRFILEYTDEVWNHGNIEAMDGYYAASYVHHDVSRPDVTSLGDYKQWARDLQSGLSEMRVVADDVIASEDGKAVKRWTATGVHTGSLAGLPPTGKRVSFSGSSAYRVENGRIVESWYVYDLFGLLQQLGALPAPA